MVAVAAVVMESDTCVMMVEGEKKSSMEKKSADKELLYTADRALLLACVYFDQSHAGYLLDKDVEDIIHTTGLQLSRAQVSLSHCLSTVHVLLPVIPILQNAPAAVTTVVFV